MERIKKGDKFECVKTVEMCDGEVTYIEGRTYISECNDCITDEQGEVQHLWVHCDIEDDWQEYFKRI